MFEERQIQGERNGVNVGRFKVKNEYCANEHAL